MESVKTALEAKGVEIEAAEISRVAQNNVMIEGKNADKILKLMEAIEDHDDVQNVYSNFDIDEAVFEE